MVIKQKTDFPKYLSITNQELAVAEKKKTGIKYFCFLPFDNFEGKMKLLILGKISGELNRVHNRRSICCQGVG